MDVTPVIDLKNRFHLTRAFLVLEAATWGLISLKLLLFPPEGVITFFKLSLTVGAALTGVVTVVVLALAVFGGGLYHVVFTDARVRWLRRSGLLGLMMLIALIPALAFTWYRFGLLPHILFGVAFLLMALYLLLLQLEEGKRASAMLIIASIGVVALGLTLRWGMILLDYVWSDEGIYLNTASSVMRGGPISAPMFRAPAEMLLRPPWGYTVAVHGLWARAAGLGLIQGRSLTYLIGVLPLPLLFQTLRRWYDRQTAWVGMALGSLSFLWMQTTFIRNDVLTLAAVSGLVLLHVWAWPQKKAWPHFLLGLAAAVALETHLVALGYMFGFGVVYLVRAVRELIETRFDLRRAIRDPLFVYVGGALLGLGVYVLVHVVFFRLGPQRYLDSMLLFLSSDTSFLLGTLQSIGWKMYYLTVYSTAETVIMVVAIIAALIRGRESDRHWVILLMGSFLGYCMAERTNEISYLLSLWPVWTLGLGPLITRGFGDRPIFAFSRTEIYRWVSGFLAASLMASYGFNMLLLRRQDRLAGDGRAVPIANLIYVEVPADRTVIGPSVLFPHLVDYRNYLLLDGNDNYLGATLAGLPPEQVWQRNVLEEHPAALIDIVPITSAVTPDSYYSYFAALGVPEGENVVLLPGWDAITTYEAPASDEFTLALTAHRIDAEGQIVLVLGVGGTAIPGGGVQVLDDAGDVLGEAVLISGWAGEPSSAWEPYSFHDVTLPLTVEQVSGPLELRFIDEAGHPIACGNAGCVLSVGG